MDIHFVQEKVVIGHVRVLHVLTSYHFCRHFHKRPTATTIFEFQIQSVQPPPTMTTKVW